MIQPVTLTEREAAGGQKKSPLTLTATFRSYGCSWWCYEVDMEFCSLWHLFEAYVEKILIQIVVVVVVVATA